VTAADLPYFEQEATAESDPWNFFGFRTPGRPTRQFHENGLLDPDHTQLVVELDGQLMATPAGGRSTTDRYRKRDRR
jgi:hypothetical protein